MGLEKTSKSGHFCDLLAEAAGQTSDNQSGAKDRPETSTRPPYLQISQALGMVALAGVTEGIRTGLKLVSYFGKGPSEINAALEEIYAPLKAEERALVEAGKIPRLTYTFGPPLSESPKDAPSRGIEVRFNSNAVGYIEFVGFETKDHKPIYRVRFEKLHKITKICSSIEEINAFLSSQFPEDAAAA